MEQPIPQFYAGRSVLVTGATGFMGKVLVEKLLRSCPQIGNVYIVIRSKRGQSAQERWDTITKLVLFDRVKEEVPGNMEKVKVVDGDITMKKFGLSDACYEEMTNSVSIVFHVAASVRFVESLDSAVQSNIIGTKNAVDFALACNTMKAFVHVSTAYSNCYKEEIEEKFYPPLADWKTLVKIVENSDLNTLRILTAKYINPMVNTYTFTKQLAETVVKDVEDRLPSVVLRPSIVICSWKEPVPGWIDNENGPIGLLIGIAKGAIRCQITDVNIRPDYMAVDIAIKAMIVAAWKKGTENGEGKLTTDIYNASSMSKSITVGETNNIGQELYKKYPMEQILWYPHVTFTKNLTVFRISCFYKHFLPALLVDSILRVMNKKPMLLKIQKKFLNAMLVLSYFTTRRWIIHNEKFLGLNKEVPASCLEDFDFNFENIDVREFFKMGIIQGKRFILNEPIENLEKSRANFNRFFWLDVFTKLAASAGFAYAMYSWLL
ncbi:putative fatty acyl-CoA reductase CG5065 [Cimex lectularius]|uniref:Fatty acyl-CoA reductase n=1 Tax=Cimex lectularius TaxID=79782 RepID=A0A8I6TF40_CIMLE|nr:putative fatty acyl-CoA reductase CG5065 [Cimex lectularius]XP_014251247.1 putative fatty acyl-CoA reductase CG5065 [Cimex lectularius]XP_014251248.1 putative fatty acyl-CoA reductase CG5065 [Cimex lectularius]